MDRAIELSGKGGKQEEGGGGRQEAAGMARRGCCRFCFDVSFSFFRSSENTNLIPRIVWKLGHCKN
jgi:hypothetical protein